MLSWRNPIGMTSDYKDGQYYYAPHRRQWGVWQHHEMSDGYAYGSFIGDFPTRDEARREVFARNGWKYNNNN